MTTLSQLITTIDKIIADPAYSEPIIVDAINQAILNIAAGIRLPNGQISPPMPQLYTYGTVTTDVIVPYVSLPSNYQRNIFNILDISKYTIPPINGGDYYSFSKFLNQSSKQDLSETGSVYRVCIKGKKLYYQGIPSSSVTLGLHYYRIPDTLSLDQDVPECFPDHLQLNLIKHYVCKEIYGEKLEDGQDNVGVGVKYHSSKFIESLMTLVDFIGIDAEPTYYGFNDFADAGICDG